MLVKKTQLSVVLKKLKKTGLISRNWCLKRNITRLGALIYIIKKGGYEISSNYGANRKDYYYKLKK